MKGIGFIGAGNMGGAMISAIAKNDEVLIYDKSISVYKKFAQCQQIVPVEDIQSLVEKVKYVVLTVKPQYYREVCMEVKKYLKSEQIVVTVAPSYTLSDMKKELGEEVKLIRTMPNTPALVSEGITAYCYNEDELSKQDLEEFEAYFTTFGRLVHVTENMMPAVVAASGSSPAYAYMFIEAMADAAVSFGMPRQMAYEFCAASIKGACEMVLKTGKHPGELKDAVTSPAGTTIDAVMALEESGFRGSVIKGMVACYNKSNEMAKNK